MKVLIFPFTKSAQPTTNYNRKFADSIFEALIVLINALFFYTNNELSLVVHSLENTNPLPALDLKIRKTQNSARILEGDALSSPVVFTQVTRNDAF